jgi:hypothetical protein
MDEARVNAWIAEFQRRLPAFEAQRRRAPPEVKQDFVSRFFAEHILLGDKSTLDGVLQGLLTDQEHAQLDMDREFTRAWRIFVDLCWVKKQFQRALWVLAGIILLFAVIIGLFLALPLLAGPGG